MSMSPCWAQPKWRAKKATAPSGSVVASSFQRTCWGWSTEKTSLAASGLSAGGIGFIK